MFYYNYSQIKNYRKLYNKFFCKKKYILDFIKIL